MSPWAEDEKGIISGTTHPTRRKGDLTPPTPQETYSHSIIVNSGGKITEHGTKEEPPCECLFMAEFSQSESPVAESLLNEPSLDEFIQDGNIIVTALQQNGKRRNSWTGRSSRGKRGRLS